MTKLLFSLFLFSAFATPKLVTYNSTIYNYSVTVNNELLFDDDYILIMKEDGGTIFRAHLFLKAIRYAKQQLRSGGTINTSNIKPPKMNAIIEKNGSDYQFFQNVAGAKMFFNSSFSSDDWQLLDEIKKVDNRTLQAARTQYGGRTWTAWYDPSVAIPSGPYVFGGLPGLIYSICDIDSMHCFTMKGTTKEVFAPEDYEIEKKRSFRKLEFDKFIKYRYKAMQNFYDHYNQNSPFNLPEMTAGQKKKYNEEEWKTFHPIEIFN